MDTYKGSAANIKNYLEQVIVKGIFQDVYALMHGDGTDRNSPLKNFIPDEFAEGTECRKIRYKHIDNEWRQICESLAFCDRSSSDNISNIKIYYDELLKKYSYKISLHMLKIGAELEKLLSFSCYYRDEPSGTKPVFKVFEDLECYIAQK